MEMSLKERMNEGILQKLSNMKKELPNHYTPTEKVLFNEAEEESVRKELLKQIELEEGSEEVDDDFFTSLSGPSQEEGNEKLVEVEYLGRVGYVDISFDKLDEDLTDDEYRIIVDSLETISFSNDIKQRREAGKVVEGYEDKAINVIFRECRKFDLADNRKKIEIVQLLSRLTYRSLKGRKVIKAVLEKASSSQHVNLAILGSGAVHERESVDAILSHMLDSYYFEVGMEALLQIRDPKAVKPLIKIINDLDVNRSDLIDSAIRLSYTFNNFGPEAVNDVFDAYINCTKKTIRPIFTIALRSFGEEAIPILSSVFQDTANDDSTLVPICMQIGSLKIPFATNLLVEAFEKYPAKRKAIIKGFSHTGDSNLLPIVMKELKNTKDYKIKEECLNAISYIGNRDNIEDVRPFLQVKENKLYLYALQCMVRLHDDASLNKYIDYLINGREDEQYTLQKNLPKMPFNILRKIAEKMLAWPDDKTILLVAALQRANLLPREIGPILQKKLDQKPGIALRMEIYKLIGKYVNTSKELLPQEVLYKAKREEDNHRIVRELDQIIKNMKNVEGRFSIIKNED